MFSPDGYLFDKEAILEYILKKKCENIKRMKEYEKQKKKEASDLVEEAEAEERSRSDQFVSDQKNILSKGKGSESAISENTISKGKGSQSAVSSISNMTQGREKELPSFWVPSQTPMCGKMQTSLLKEPDQTVYCPMSGRPLRSKDLFDVVFTPIDSKPDPATSSATSSATRTVSCLCKCGSCSRFHDSFFQERYMCPVTRDVLGNSVPCTYLKTSKSVVTSECVEKIIRKDMIDPINNKRLKESDLIPLQRGGTGFSSTNQVEAAITKPSIQA